MHRPGYEIRRLGLLAALFFCGGGSGRSQEEAPKPVLRAPARAEGEGPFDRLILRGATVIDGTGAPAVGPVDIVIERNRITQIRNVGFPGIPIDETRRPQASPGDKVLDLNGLYVLPGLIDLHGHIGGDRQGTPAEYVLKLWMGHGITTIRDPGSGNGVTGRWSTNPAAQKTRLRLPASRPMRDSASVTREISPRRNRPGPGYRRWRRKASTA